MIWRLRPEWFRLRPASTRSPFGTLQLIVAFLCQACHHPSNSFGVIIQAHVLLCTRWLVYRGLWASGAVLTVSIRLRACPSPAGKTCVLRFAFMIALRVAMRDNSDNASWSFVHRRRGIRSQTASAKALGSVPGWFLHVVSLSFGSCRSCSSRVAPSRSSAERLKYLNLRGGAPVGDR